MTLSFGSLFTGIGGFDLGFEQAGLHCAWQVEIDTRCNEVLAHHWPDVQRYGDVKDIGRHNLESVDIITGGFPCQGLSVAGRRAGLADERSGLWWEFHRIIEELCPHWVVIENVPGLLSSNEGRDMAAIVGALAELRYGWAYRSLDAQFYGVAQRRRRVFIVGCLGDQTSAVKVLFEPKSLSWDTAPSREAGERVADPITKSFAKHRGASAGKDSCLRNAIVYQCYGGNVGPMGALRRGTGGLTGGIPFVFDWQSGGDVRLNISEGHTSALQASQTPAVANVYPTLRGQPNQGPGRMADDAAMAGMARRLTPTECERLQGFPDHWTAINGMKDTPRYRMLGNAVCVPVAKWIGVQIVKIEREHQ